MTKSLSYEPVRDVYVSSRDVKVARTELVDNVQSVIRLWIVQNTIRVRFQPASRERTGYPSYQCGEFFYSYIYDGRIISEQFLHSLLIEYLATLNYATSFIIVRSALHSWVWGEYKRIIPDDDPHLDKLTDVDRLEPKKVGRPRKVKKLADLQSESKALGEIADNAAAQ
jgi:hypothetical protein